MDKTYPRLMFAAPKSGSGKTVVTLAILGALMKRGISCVSFKCGPDYIDPMFHKKVLGIEGANLDTWFLGRAGVRRLFMEKAENQQFSVLEGVMGYYDGVGGDSLTASSYDLACAVSCPVVLVVDAKGSSLSAAALIKGFAEFKSDSRICGVILNRTKPAMAKKLIPALESMGIRLYGCLPDSDEAVLDSRHLGLVLPEELDGIKQRLDGLAALAEQYMEVDGLIELAQQAGSFNDSFGGTEKTAAIFGTAATPETSVLHQLKIGIARDEAFCFYYQENMDMLSNAGAELVEFSPLKDSRLPDQLDALIFGGGYPELYAGVLSENRSMRRALYEALVDGIPFLAECGGFMYLQEQLENQAGEVHPMVGFLKGRSYPVGKLSRFGYITVTPYEDTVFLKKGEVIRGHEFHYWDTTENGSSMKAEKPKVLKAWDCFVAAEHGMGGFPHLYYPSNPVLVTRFLKEAERYHLKKKADLVPTDQLS